MGKKDVVDDRRRRFVSTTDEGRGYVSCSCCTALIEDVPAENVSFGEVPYPHDTGFGMCRDCGGDPDTEDIREQMGWAFCMFVDARIQRLAEKLNEANRAKLLAMPYWKQASMVVWAIEKGWMT